MRVYLDEDGRKRLVGRADVPGDAGPVYEVPLFTAASVVMERFTIGPVTHLAESGDLMVERAVILAPGQLAELLPAWVPLAS